MTDQSRQRAATSHEVRLPILGVAATFTTNSPEVLDALHGRLGSWAALPPHVVTDSSHLVRVFVEPSGGGGPGPSFPSYHVPDPTRFVVWADGAFGVADTRRAESLAYVAPAWASRPVSLVDDILEPLTLFLAGARDRTPLHAAAVVRRGAALLLAGPSGAGKSTLAYAARAAGFSTLADEPVYVQTTPALRVWGRHGRLHLAEDARRHFPELGAEKPVELASGKSKIVIEAAAGWPRYAERVGVCLLSRAAAAPPRLVALSPGEVVETLTRRLDPGFDLFADSVGECIERVAAGGAWALHWSGGPHEAVPLLRRAAAALEGR